MFKFKKSLPLMAVLTMGLTASTAYVSPSQAKDMASQEQKVINNDYWWPNRLDLTPLRKNDAIANPLGKDFDYAKEFNKLDLKALKKEIRDLKKAISEGTSTKEE